MYAVTISGVAKLTWFWEDFRRKKNTNFGQYYEKYGY